MAGSTTLDDDRELITFRAPREHVDAVRLIARREAETQATILRRLLRAGLALEQRQDTTVAS